jgi:hypothetical protein
MKWGDGEVGRGIMNYEVGKWGSGGIMNYEVGRGIMNYEL